MIKKNEQNRSLDLEAIKDRVRKVTSGTVNRFVGGKEGIWQDNETYAEVGS